MNSIYGHFLLTIIAISGLDANTGLPGVRPNTRPLRYIPVDEMHEVVALTDRLGTIMGTSGYEQEVGHFRSDYYRPAIFYVPDWQYFFSCLTKTCCEDAVSDKPLDEDLDPHNASPNCLTRRLAALQGCMPPQMALSIYAEVIENFSGQSLTSPFDIVDAIAGINSIAVGSLGGCLCCGGPGALLEHCLFCIPKAGHQPIQNTK